MAERSGLGWSLAFILLRVLLLLGRASTSQVMSYLASLPCPGCASQEHQLLTTVPVTILGNTLAPGPHPFPHSLPAGLAGPGKICIQGCGWQAHHWASGDSGVTAGQAFIWGYSWSQQRLKKVPSIAISITQAIPAEHPKSQHHNTHPSLTSNGLFFPSCTGSTEGTGP